MKAKIRKLKIVKIYKDLNNVVIINGALPGKPGNLLRITPSKIVGKNIPKNGFHCFTSFLKLIESLYCILCFVLCE